MSAGAAAPRYYAHVDGLRAVAVLAVMAYHLDAAWLPGGFTGVDVFFVISGYVVSASLHAAAAHGSRGAMTAFYVRRLRRIAPALVACLLVSGLAAVLLVPPGWLAGASERTGLWAFIGLGNVALARADGDYFSPQAEYDPYAHTWSLGVEEQFYLLFPLVFLAWVRGGAGRRVALALLVGAAAASLGYAWYHASHGAAATAFYLLPGRFWQLAVGVLLYQWLASRAPIAPPASTLRGVGAWFSLALLGWGLATARPGHTPWPDGLWPVLGALVLLAALHDPPGRPVLGRWLSAAPVATIGRLSYSLYLWHWPVFVLFRWTVGLECTAARTVALALAVLLAVASYRGVEQPLRRSRAGERWPRPLWLGTAVVLLVGAGLLFRGLHEARDRLSLSVVVRNAGDWYADRPPPPVPGKPCTVAVQRDDRDGSRRWRWRRVGCPDPASPRRVFVLGDSHALAYARLLQSHVRASGDEVRLWHRTGCPVVALDRAPQATTAACGAAVEGFFAEVRAQARTGDVLFLPSLRVPRLSEHWSGQGRFVPPESPTPEARRAAEAEALVDLRPLLEAGVHVVLEAPKPVLPSPPYRCSDVFNAANPVCAGGLETPRAAQEAHRAPVLESFGRLRTQWPGLSVWDPLPLLCDADVCRAQRGGRPLFFDGDHLSGHANDVLAADFTRYLAALPHGAPR